MQLTTIQNTGSSTGFLKTALCAHQPQSYINLRSLTLSPLQTVPHFLRFKLLQMTSY